MLGSSDEFDLGATGKLRFSQSDAQDVLGNVRAFRVFLNDAHIGDVTNSGARQIVALPDGALLHVRFRSGLFGSGDGWEVARDGVPLGGSLADPKRAATEAALIFAGAAVLTAIAAGLAVAGVDFIRAAGVDGWAFIDAAVFAILAWFAHRRSPAAIALGLLLVVAGGVRAFAMIVPGSGHTSPGPGLLGATLVRVGVCVALGRSLVSVWKGRRPLR